MRNINRWKKIILSGLLSLTVVTGLVGCGASSSPATSTASGSAAGKSDDELVIAVADEYANIDILHAYSTEVDLVLNQVLEGLYYYDKNSEIQPKLAKSFEQPDDTTYVYQIKDDVDFSDGTHLTAEDVAFSLERHRNPENSSELGWMFENVKSIKQTGDYEVTVKLKQPDALWQDTLATTASLVISKKYFEENKDNFGTAKGGIIGSGPYKISSWDQGVQLELEVNKNWWDKDTELAFKKLTYKTIPDAAVVKSALESGEVDVTQNISAETANELESSGKAQISATDYYGTTFLSFNNSKKPFNDANVRKAIASAIDREQIVNTLYYGKYAQKGGDTPINENFIREEKEVWADFFKNANNYNYDVEKAKEYLAKSSVPNGFEAKFVYETSEPVHESIGLVVQQNLAKIGIKLELEGLTRAEIMNYRYGGTEKRDYDVMVTGWGSDYPDPIGVILPMFATKNTAAGGSNWAEYRNDKFDKLLEKSSKELDKKKRAAILKDALNVYIEDEPSVNLYHHYKLFATSNRVDYEFSPSLMFGTYIKDFKKK